MPYPSRASRGTPSTPLEPKWPSGILSCHGLATVVPRSVPAFRLRPAGGGPTAPGRRPHSGHATPPRPNPQPKKEIRRQAASSPVALTRMIHGGFYCTRRYATATRWPLVPRSQLGGLTAQSVNVLFQGRFPPSRLRAPVSHGVLAVSSRTLMNHAGFRFATFSDLLFSPSTNIRDVFSFSSFARCGLAGRPF
jgi:hypothetical protein